MLSFLRKGSQVEVWLAPEIRDLEDSAFVARIEFSDAYYAALAETRLRAVVNKKLELIRRRAYLEGFADAKAKRRKQTYFSLGWFLTDDDSAEVRRV